MFQRLINFCWFVFKWGLVLGVIGGVAAIPWFYRQVDEQIRLHIQTQVAQQYPGLKVVVRSAVVVEGQGIEVRGLSVLEPGAEGPGAELLSLDECFFACRTELKELISGPPRITRVTIRRPTLRVTRRPDGTWSAAKLLPLPKLSNRPPEVTIENGTVEIFDPLKNPSSTLTLRDVNLTMVPQGAALGADGAPRYRQLRGRCGGDHFRQITLEGLVDPQAPECALHGTVEGLEISPELREALPQPLADRLAALASLRGQGDFSFHVAYQDARLAPALVPDAPGTSAGAKRPAPTLSFDLSGRLTRGRVDDPRLPYPLTDIRANVRCNNQGLVIDELTARSNQATLRMSCRRAGLTETSPMTLVAEVRQLDLDRRLQDVLPDALQLQWHKYLPSGRVDADVKLAYDGQTWRPELSVQCLDVAFTHYKFPYRLDHGRGTLEMKNDVIQLRLKAFSGTQPVDISAEVQHPLAGPTGWVEARGDEMPLDEKLFDALPATSRPVVRSLEPRGTVNFVARFWRDDPQQPMRQYVVVNLNRCGMRYSHFPYPLGNVCGTLEMHDGNWTFRNLEGGNGAGRVSGTGSLTATPQGKELWLRLAAVDVPLEEELRDALKPSMQQVWSDLKPRGIIDLDAEVRYVAETKQLGLSVLVRPQSDTTSIEPIRFPYRLEKLHGTMVYRDGHVTLDHFKAEHGLVRMAAGGYCDFLPDGRWHLRLEGLSVDRLRLDRDLVQALPGRLKKALVALEPVGPVNLSGSFDLLRETNVTEPMRAQWDFRVGLHQTSIDCGVMLKNLFGAVTLAGAFDGRQFYSRGELALDSLTYKDYQLTDVRGPVWIDDQRVLLGSWVDRPQGAWIGPQGTPRAETAGDPRAVPVNQVRPLTARLFGGNVYGDGWILLGDVPRYGLQANLVDADVSLCAQEVMTGRQKLRGKVGANVELRGNGRSRNALAGHGTIRLNEADIYELPLMISLLKILSIRTPDQTAFSKSDIDFRIEGEHIYFDRVDFKGDAISLLGKGEMDFESNIRLTFGAIVGRGELNLPLLREIIGGASQQIMTIRVGGTLQNPDMRKEAFPGVNQALQELRDDLQRSTSAPGLWK